MLFRDGPQLLLHFWLIGPAFHAMETCQYALDVAIENDGSLPCAERNNSSGSRAAYAWQFTQFIHCARELALEFIGHPLSRLVQVAGARVIAESGPQV